MMKDQPIDSCELILFLLDGSYSMTWEKTVDKKPKIEKQTRLTRGVLDRLKGSSKSARFRIGVVYFSTEIYKDKIGKKFFGPLNQFEFHEATKKVKPDDTAIADALLATEEMITQFLDEKALPKIKKVTIFLFTDGCETIKQNKDVIEAQKKLDNNYGDMLQIATISFGTDADEDLLKTIASKPRPEQIRALNNSGLIKLLPDKNTLFVEGHIDDKISDDKIEAIREFVFTISETNS